jgi:hypothetical protein
MAIEHTMMMVDFTERITDCGAAARTDGVPGAVRYQHGCRGGFLSRYPDDQQRARPANPADDR